MSTAREGFRTYFKKMIKAWDSQFGSRPKIPFDDELDRELLLNDPGVDGLAEWLPREVINPSLPNQIGDVKLSDFVIEYLDAYHFLAAGGRFGEFAIQLSPITSAFLNGELPMRLAAYRGIHGGSLLNVPIGVETKTGKMVVLANSADSAVVSIEDDETFELTRVASSPYDLLVQLEP